jgi:hypothetical protein
MTRHPRRGALLGAASTLLGLTCALTLQGPTTAATEPSSLTATQPSSLTASSSGWGHPYNGSGAYGVQGVRLGSNTQFADGVLTVWCRPVTKTTTMDGKTLRVGDYAGGGISHSKDLRPGTRIALDVRMKASIGTRAVALLWPEAAWPAGGEVDFIEDGANQPTRQSTWIANHWSSNGTPAQKIIKFSPHNFTAWSRVVMVWKSGSITVSVDGRQAAKFTEHIPHGVMHLVVQTAVAKGGQSKIFDGATRTPGNIQVRNLSIGPA